VAFDRYKDCGLNLAMFFWPGIDGQRPSGRGFWVSDGLAGGRDCSLKGKVERYRLVMSARSGRCIAAVSAALAQSLNEALERSPTGKLVIVCRIITMYVAQAEGRIGRMLRAARRGGRRRHDASLSVTSMSSVGSDRRSR